LSYEYGVPFNTIVELSPMAFKAHVDVLKDIAKERSDASKTARRNRS
jgi:hypothetical protein